MSHHKYHVFAVLLTVVFALCGFTACGEKSSQEEASIAMEDLPYGATMVTNETLPVLVEYDKRYFEEAEYTAISNYFYAIQTKDETLYDENTLDLYMDYIVTEMYQGLVGLDGLLTQQHDTYAQQAGGTEFTFTKVAITEVQQDTDTVHGDLDNLCLMLDALSGEEGYSDAHVSEGKFLKLEITTAADATTTVLEEQYLFVICVDGQYQICS